MGKGSIAFVIFSRVFDSKMSMKPCLTLNTIELLLCLCSKVLAHIWIALVSQVIKQKTGKVLSRKLEEEFSRLLK